MVFASFLICHSFSGIITVVSLSWPLHLLLSLVSFFLWFLYLCLPPHLSVPPFSCFFPSSSLIFLSPPSHTPWSTHGPCDTVYLFPGISVSLVLSFSIPSPRFIFSLLSEIILFWGFACGWSVSPTLTRQEAL